MRQLQLQRHRIGALARTPVLTADDGRYVGHARRWLEYRGSRRGATPKLGYGFRIELAEPVQGDRGNGQRLRRDHARGRGGLAALSALARSLFGDVDRVLKVKNPKDSSPDADHRAHQKPQKPGGGRQHAALHDVRCGHRGVVAPSRRRDRSAPVSSSALVETRAPPGGDAFAQCGGGRAAGGRKQTVPPATAWVVDPAERRSGCPKRRGVPIAVSKECSAIRSASCGCAPDASPGTESRSGSPRRRPRPTCSSISTGSRSSRPSRRAGTHRSPAFGGPSEPAGARGTLVDRGAYRRKPPPGPSRCAPLFEG